MLWMLNKNCFELLNLNLFYFKIYNFELHENSMKRVLDLLSFQFNND
jgi:hypothetical protein